MSAAFLSSASSTIAAGELERGALLRGGRRIALRQAVGSRCGRRLAGGAASVTVGGPPGFGRAHGRRYTPRPHRARDSAAIGRQRTLAEVRGRQAAAAVRPGTRRGRPRPGTARRASRVASGKPSRGATAMRGQLQDAARLLPRPAGRERLRGQDEHDVRRVAATAGLAQRSSVSTVYDGPSRSTSIRLSSERRVAGDRQLDHRDPVRAGRDGRPGLCGGRPAGTNSTRSRPRASRASSAIARWRDVDGSNVPPRTPSAPTGARSGAAAAGHRLLPGLRLPLELTAADAHQCRPAAIPARRSSASMPRRARSRWNRSADSSTSKLVWAAIRSMRLPRTRKHAVVLALDHEAVAHARRCGGRRRRPARAVRPAPRRDGSSRRPGTERVHPLPGRRGDRHGLEPLGFTRRAERGPGLGAPPAGRSC